MNIPSFDTSIDHEEPSKSDLIPCICNLWNGKQQMSVSYSFTTNQNYKMRIGSCQYMPNNLSIIDWTSHVNEMSNNKSLLWWLFKRWFFIIKKKIWMKQIIAAATTAQQQQMKMKPSLKWPHKLLWNHQFNEHRFVQIIIGGVSVMKRCHERETHQFNNTPLTLRIAIFISTKQISLSTWAISVW